MTDKRAVQALGEELAGLLLHAAIDPRWSDGERVTIPIDLLGAVARLLFALPGSRRGRPPKKSTSDLLQLLANAFSSKRKLARAVSSVTGEPVENLRRRLRPKKPSKLKSKGGT